MFERGSARIEKSIGTFEVIRQDLLTGVAEVDSETEDNNLEIDRLQNLNSSLAKSKRHALKLVNNLTKMLGE